MTPRPTLRVTADQPMANFWGSLLWLAFGSMSLLLGQVVGKTYMTALALPLVWLARKQVAR